MRNIHLPNSNRAELDFTKQKGPIEDLYVKTYRKMFAPQAPLLLGSLRIHMLLLEAIRPKAK